MNKDNFSTVPFVLCNEKKEERNSCIMIGRVRRETSDPAPLHFHARVK